MTEHSRAVDEYFTADETKNEPLPAAPCECGHGKGYHKMFAFKCEEVDCHDCNDYRPQTARPPEAEVPTVSEAEESLIAAGCSLDRAKEIANNLYAAPSDAQAGEARLPRTFAEVTARDEAINKAWAKLDKEERSGDKSYRWSNDIYSDVWDAALKFAAAQQPAPDAIELGLHGAIIEPHAIRERAVKMLGIYEKPDSYSLDDIVLFTIAEHSARTNAALEAYNSASLTASSPGRIRTDWTPVEVGLPEVEGGYLVQTKWGIDISAFDTVFGIDHEVLAWMPLPQPYQALTQHAAPAEKENEG